jgi:hypothetical protein
MALCALTGANGQAQADTLAQMRARLPQQEVIYFVLPDRFANGDTANDKGGLQGDRLVTGFDPSSKAFYHGGDLKGLIAHLDYIQSLGASALWVGPIMKNKPVQGPKATKAPVITVTGSPTSSMSTRISAAMRISQLVDAAHARGMKVYMDIIVNHTADVIQYREAVDGPAPIARWATIPFRARAA